LRAGEFGKVGDIGEVEMKREVDALALVIILGVVCM
jgi:hypothetical protein